MSLDRHKYCRDPFKKHRRRIYSNLRVAPEKLIAEYPSLSLRSGDLLCVNCLIAIKRHCSEVASEHTGPSGLSQECAVPSNFTPYSSTQDSDSASDNDSPAGSPALHNINKTLSSQEVSPIRKRYIHSQKYVAEKCRRLMEVVEENIQLATGARPEAVHTDDGAEIIQQLKEKFALTKSRSEMIRILTVLPKSWSVA